MRLAHQAIAASLLAAFAVGPVVAQSSSIEPISFFGQRRSWQGFAPPQSNCAPSPTSPTMPFDPNPAVTPNPKDPSPLAAIDPGAQASLAGTGGGMPTALPQSIGDVGSYYRVLRTFDVPSLTTTTVTQTATDPSSPGKPAITTVNQTTISRTTVSAYETVISRAGSGFKIGDNESPRPMDRMSFTYNGYFNTPTFSSPNIIQSGPMTSVAVPNGAGGTTTTATSSTTTISGIPARSVDVHRGMFAFEKAFLDGNASVGIRLPIFGTTGGSNNDPNFVGNAFGDMSVIAKYALINNPQTNNVFTTGIVVTFPTGPAIPSVEGNINSVLFQPFVGYIYSFGGPSYMQGFSSVVLPTNSNDVVVWFNDVSFGFVAWRNFNPDAGLTAIIPMVEVHVTTPLNQRGADSIVQAFDIVSLTGGVHLGVGQRSWLTLGVNSPVTGPRPYEVEAIAQFNYRY
jgi:hypothetical protein